MIGVLIVIAASAVLLPYAFTVVPVQQQADAEQNETFDPARYVDGIWDRIVSTILEDAVSLADVLNAVEPDAGGFVPKAELIEVAERFGQITVGEAHVYMVKASGTVGEVDTSSSRGTMDVRIEGYPGPITVKVYVGPRLPSDESSVRDAVGFISFGDFKDQTEYGKVSAEINKRVSAGVLSTLDKDALEGREVAFVGALTVRTFNLVSIDVSEVNVVPISVTAR